ncbi:MAG: SLBB domain-containing protein [Synergistaceae bacterium]|jgi:Na+-translocating ferredoxin:NAD+ oxidoreductase RnfC subunit|nr:SLBB domain-containing protein [Synergistaceae bacterium]
MNDVSELIRSAGVVGCGGAGFPTYAKLQGRVEYFIANGAECEPLLQTDRYIMRHCPDEVVSALARVGEAAGASRCVVALKETYAEEIEAISSGIGRTGAPVTVCAMRSFYPAGDEQAVVREVTGRVVPPGGIPIDVGCAVSNAATLLAAFDAMNGRPFTRKFLTVSGEVRSPAIVSAPVGTPLSDCLSLAGGASADDYCVLLGGPMMGRIISKEETGAERVTKTTSGVIILPRDNRLSAAQSLSDRQISVRARAACIRCSQCTDLCPRYLLGHPLEPHKIMRRLALCGDLRELPLDEPVVRSAALCCECGICELVACPMNLQPRRVNAALRRRLSSEGIRYRRGEGQREAHPLRDMRKIPSERAAARAGVARYKHIHIDSLAEAHPHTVFISMSQHIGAPCVPVVEDGVRVRAGDLIASSPVGNLGSNIHASIDGVVAILESSIAISSGGSHKG